MSTTRAEIRSRRNVRLGLVIREVLALIIIPQVLLALYLPVVQAQREAARRMMCSNNLKQHGLAILNFASTFKRLPPGCSTTLGVKLGQEYRLPKERQSMFAWGVGLLPYQDLGDSHELSNVFTTIHEGASDDFSTCYQGPRARKILESPISIHRCPSDNLAPLQNIGRPFEFGSDQSSAIALSNYVGANGSGDLAANDGDANGLFFVNSRLRFSDVTDGTSNTIAFGERAWIRSSWHRYHPRAAVVFGVRSNQDHSYYGIADALAAGRFRLNFEAIKQPDGLGESYLRRGYSSNHTGGAMFVMADGSVHFLSETMDADMDSITHLARTSFVDSAWERLLSRNDGQKASGDFD